MAIFDHVWVTVHGDSPNPHTFRQLDMTGCDLRTIIQLVYHHSMPQGMGIMHYEPGPLTDEELDEILQRQDRLRPGLVLSLDYVKGRACKFRIRRVMDSQATEPPGVEWVTDVEWFDHTPADFIQLQADYLLVAERSWKASPSKDFAVLVMQERIQRFGPISEEEAAEFREFIGASE